MTVNELIDKLVTLNPLLVYIERYEPDDKKRLIIAPNKDKEVKNSRWGRVLKISTAPIEDEFMEWRRKKIKVGMYVRFNPSNPVFGPSEKWKKVCCVGVDDIFDMLSPEDYERFQAEEVALEGAMKGVTVGEFERTRNPEPIA